MQPQDLQAGASWKSYQQAIELLRTQDDDGSNSTAKLLGSPVTFDGKPIRERQGSLVKIVPLSIEMHGRRSSESANHSPTYTLSAYASGTISSRVPTTSPLRFHGIKEHYDPFNTSSQPSTPKTPTVVPRESPASYVSLSWDPADRRKDVVSMTQFDPASLDSPPSLSNSLRLSDRILSSLELSKMKLRHNCIRELYNTEWQFAQDMAVVVRIYLCDSASVGFSVREIDTLFTNCSEILDLSLCMVAIFENQIPHHILVGEGGINSLDVEADKDVRVGRAMCIGLTGQLYEIYEHYIRRNAEQMRLYYELTQYMNDQLQRRTSAVDLISTSDATSSPKSTKSFASSKRTKKSIVEDKPVSSTDMIKFSDWLTRSKHRANKFTTAWALDCLLIKPIQRLGKYPLFLKTLLMNTDPRSPDFRDLERAYKRSKHYLDCVNSRLGE